MLSGHPSRACLPFTSSWLQSWVAIGASATPLKLGHWDTLSKFCLPFHIFLGVSSILCSCWHSWGAIRPLKLVVMSWFGYYHSPGNFLACLHIWPFVSWSLTCLKFGFLNYFCVRSGESNSGPEVFQSNAQSTIPHNHRIIYAQLGVIYDH